MTAWEPWSTLTWGSTMADPRDDMTELELMNAGVPRITVTPEPPSLGKPWGESGRLFEPDLSPAAPPAAQADADLGARLAGQYRGGGRLPPDAAPTLPVERYPLGSLPRPEDLPDLSRPPQPWQGQSPRVRAAPTTPEEDFGRALGQVGQPAPTNRVYNALGSVVQGAADVIGPAIPPELRPKLQGAAEASQMVNPAVMLRDYTQAASQGKYGEAALNALGLIPGEGVAAGVAKLGGLAAAGKTLPALFVPVMNPAKIAKAEQYEAQGMSSGQLWRLEKVTRGQDNVLMEEIPDINARFTGINQESVARNFFDRNYPNLNWDGRGTAVQQARQHAMNIASNKLAGTNGYQLQLEDILHHPELYNHPAIKQATAAGFDIRKMPVQNDQTMSALGEYYARSGYNPQGKIKYRISDEDLPGNLEQGSTRGTVLHETGHGIANLFGMAKGASINPLFEPGSQADKIFQQEMLRAPRILSKEEYLRTYPGTMPGDYNPYVENMQRKRDDFVRASRAVAANRAYGTSYGEGLARVIEQRAYMTPEQLATVDPKSQFFPRQENTWVAFNEPYNPQAARPEAQSAQRPTTFWRGTNPEDPRRISTGIPSWDQNLFISSSKDSAGMYGKTLTQYEALPGTRILYEGTPEWRKVAGTQRKGENLLEYADRAAKAAKEAGYHAAHFQRQGDVGTVVFNPERFVSQARPEAQSARPGSILGAPAILKGSDIPVNQLLELGHIPQGTNQAWTLRYDPTTGAPSLGAAPGHGFSSLATGKPVEDMVAGYTGAPRIIPAKTFNPSDLEGKTLVLGVTDRTKGVEGAGLDQLSGRSIDPVRQEAGISFPTMHAGKNTPDVPKGADPLFASVSKGAAGRITNTAKAVQEAGGDPYFTTINMAHGSGDSSKQVATSALRAAKQSDLKEGAVEAIDKAMAQMSSGLSPPPSPYPGFASDTKVLEQWLDEAGLPYRSAFVKALDTGKVQKAGVHDIGEVRFANTDPRLYSTPTGSGGLVVGRMRPEIGYRETDLHSNYPYTIFGQRGEIGALPGSAPFALVAPDLHRLLLPRTRPKEGTSFANNPNYYVMQGIPGGVPPTQKVTPEVVDYLSRWFEKHPQGWSLAGGVAGTGAIGSLVAPNRQEEAY